MIENHLVQGLVMERTRLSLFYLVGYLISGGVMLLVAPCFSLKLLFSNTDYGNIFPRVVGMLFIGLGFMIFQIIRLRVSSLYSSTLIVRSFFVICFFSFYLLNRDPFFLVLSIIVGIGIALTTTSYMLDQRHVLRSQQKS